MTFCNQSGAEALRYFYGLIPMLVPSQRSHWDVANVLQWHREIRLRPDPSASKHGNMALMRLSGRCDCTLIAPLERCICARHGRSVGRSSPSQRAHHSVLRVDFAGRWLPLGTSKHDDHGIVQKPGHAANDDAAGAAGCRGMHAKCLG